MFTVRDDNLNFEILKIQDGGQSISKMWRFFDFSKWRPPSWIFKIAKF